MDFLFAVFSFIQVNNISGYLPGRIVFFLVCISRLTQTTVIALWPLSTVVDSFGKQYSRRESPQQLIGPLVANDMVLASLLVS
jgi:hypothetical protein